MLRSTTAWHGLLLAAAMAVPLASSCCPLIPFDDSPFLEYQQHLLSPDGKSNFVLYHDYSGFGDPAWYVLRVDATEQPDTLQIPRAYTNESTAEERAWMEKTLMWNWSEAGHHTKDPHIELLKNRYLVFVRGDLYHALYDIEENKTHVSDESPWHSWVYSRDDEDRERPVGDSEESVAMEQWTRKTLHDPNLIGTLNFKATQQGTGLEVAEREPIVAQYDIPGRRLVGGTYRQSWSSPPPWGIVLRVNVGKPRPRIADVRPSPPRPVLSPSSAGSRLRDDPLAASPRQSDHSIAVGMPRFPIDTIRASIE